MRSLTDTLKAAQQAMVIDALAKIVLTLGESTHTYDRDRILDIKHSEEPDRQSAEVLLDNADGALTDLDLRGYQGVISYGAITSEGEEYSACAPLKVIAQQGFSAQGVLVCNLSLAGIPNLVNEDKANADYKPESDDTKTVKTLIREILGDTGVSILACFNHCASYDVVFDSEDSLIDTFQPKDSFSITQGQSRLDRINWLLSFTKCVKRVESDGKFHIFVPTPQAADWVAETEYSLTDKVKPTTENGFEYICTTAGISDSEQPTWPTTENSTVEDGTAVWTIVWYDYEYIAPSVPGSHTFFDKTNRKRIVIPNYIVVSSHPSHEESYTGYAEDTDSSDLIEIRDYKYLRVSSNAQCTAIATAILAHYQWDAEKGHGFAPMNVGAEVHDYIKITDARENDSRVGNIGYLQRHYRAGRFELEFRFGSIVQTGLAGTLSPSQTSGGVSPDITNIINAINELYQQLQDIRKFLESYSTLKCPLHDYIYINTDKDVCICPGSGAWVQLLGDLSLLGGEHIGPLLATENTRVFWHTASGTLDHSYCPDTDAHGKLGELNYKWLEGWIKKIYCDTEMYIPGEA